MKRGSMESSDELLSCVQRERLAEDLRELVRIPSPTRQERQVALVFADMLKRAGDQRQFLQFY